MSLRTAISLFLEEYPEAIKKPFSGNAVADFIRNEIPIIIEKIIDKNPRYLVNGSAGQGNWAKAPWAAVYDRFITESAQDGYYIVYLVKEDFTGVYLSLNQGVTSVRKQYGSKAKLALRVRAADFVARIGKLPTGVTTGEIDLNSSDSSNLSSLYEAGSICSKYYPLTLIPTDEELASDLQAFINIYYLLMSRETQLYERIDAEEEGLQLDEEDFRKLREHKHLERNRKLASRAKKIHGYVCMACGFDFEKKYGGIGKEFIEAHHLTPISDLKGQLLKLDPRKDFAVLCSNCHRMIHRTSLVNNISGFKTKHVLDNNT
ncbi:MrcB family domain-containing protein [Aquirhabdus parva]|uniref:DUF3578 domain-containing protein n=1 Tax=Aquirhabdus parva TaxID=2283318 RepID=A0A345P4F9_9GAMM|nr:DUF3578 domain-containing protein [Aquirhabdus parva]AXI02168.1 DUF3578 domain-containing protein [Aquirhabdus parva]